MAPKMVLKVKEEVERLLKAEFIWLIRYVEWLSNIDLVVKKMEKYGYSLTSKTSTWLL